MLRFIKTKQKTNYAKWIPYIDRDNLVFIVYTLFGDTNINRKQMLTYMNNFHGHFTEKTLMLETNIDRKINLIRNSRM